MTHRAVRSVPAPRGEPGPKLQDAPGCPGVAHPGKELSKPHGLRQDGRRAGGGRRWSGLAVGMDAAAGGRALRGNPEIHWALCAVTPGLLRGLPELRVSHLQSEEPFLVLANPSLLILPPLAHFFYGELEEEVKVPRRSVP